MHKILVIEDNTEIRENICEILEMAQYQSFAAENGMAGVSMAKTVMPDLIICDIMMPELDGFGVLHMLQKDPMLQSIPFIFLTAKSERWEVRKGMEMGADDYIIKPFNGTEMLNAVESRLKKNELLRKDFQPGVNGVNMLISTAEGEHQLELLKQGRNLATYKSKQYIYMEGSFPSRLFYITEGKVKTYKRNADGKELVMNLYNSGDFLGFAALLDASKYEETAETLEETSLIEIPKSEFEHLIGSNPAVMKKFISILARNFSEKEEQLLSLAYNSLRKKVADALVVLYKKYNPDQIPNFEIDLSRENLAAIAGVATESFIRTLSDFKNDNLVAMDGRKITILNFARLEKMYN